MAGITKDKLFSALTKAQKLCAPDSTAQTAKSTRESMELFESQARDAEKALGFGMDDDEDYNDALYEDRGASRRALNYNSASAAKSSIPDNIKKSMLEHKIDVGQPQVSVLDGLGIPKQKAVPRQKLGEQAVPQAIPAAPVSSVDYSIIKAIVNECLNEYFSRRPLNESTTIDTIGFKGGNLTVIDNKGNVFGARLQKIQDKDE